MIESICNSMNEIFSRRREYLKRLVFLCMSLEIGFDSIEIKRVNKRGVKQKRIEVMGQQVASMKIIEYMDCKAVKFLGGGWESVELNSVGHNKDKDRQLTTCGYTGIDL